jgi:hypothetical protein
MLANCALKAIRRLLVESPTVQNVLPSETREERVTFLHNGSQVTKIQWAWYFD